jgi:Uma2 family endonuclease
VDAVKPQLLTAEDFWRLPGSGKRRILVRGEVIETMPPGGRHGAVALRLGARLEAWVRSGPGGYVGVESRFVLRRNPDTVRGPDISYVRADRIPSTGIPEAFWEIAPDLAVEMMSSSESAEEVREKVRDYLVAGTPLVWVIYPRTQEVVVHTPDGLARTYGTHLWHAPMARTYGTHLWQQRYVERVRHPFGLRVCRRRVVRLKAPGHQDD